MITQWDSGSAQRGKKDAAGQYDLAEFARRYGLSAVKAKEILERVHYDRKLADDVIAARMPDRI